LLNLGKPSYTNICYKFNIVQMAGISFDLAPKPIQHCPALPRTAQYKNIQPYLYMFPHYSQKLHLLENIQLVF